MPVETTQPDIQKKMKELSEQVGKNIFYLRRKRNLTQEKLAEQLNINSQALISQYEHATKTPTLEKLFEFASFFEISLEDLLFSDLSPAQKSEPPEYSDPIDKASPIQKCARRTYYCYYIREQDDGKADYTSQVVCRRIDILTPTSSHSAPALLYQNSEKQSEVIDGQLNMDESYAYIRFHDTRHDFYFGLCFFYYRQKTSKRYTGGMALMQTTDQHNVPVSQFCIISINAISNKRYGALKGLLQIDVSKKDEKLSKRNFSSQSIFRLTKEKDKKVFNWLVN